MEMENSNPSNHSKKSFQRSSNSHLSLSDTESITSQVDSWHSALRLDSPVRSDDPSFRSDNDDSGLSDSRPLVLVNKYHSPVPSPGKSSVPASSAAAGRKGMRPWPHSEKNAVENLDSPVDKSADGGKEEYSPSEKPVSENLDIPQKGPSPVVLGINKFVRDEPPPGLKKVGPVGGGGGLEEGRGGGGGGENEVGGDRRSRAAVDSILKRSERSVVVKKAALGLRVFEAIVCLVSFSVMAADKTQGWSGDSFDRYKEYRYIIFLQLVI